MDTSGLTSLVGILKIATIVIGVVDLGLTADSYIHNWSEEEYYLAIVIIAFIVSIVMLVLTLFKILPTNSQGKYIDMGVHALMALLLGIGAIIMANQTRKSSSWRTTPGLKGLYVERVIATILGFLNTVIYAFITFAVFRSSPQA